MKTTAVEEDAEEVSNHDREYPEETYYETGMEQDEMWRESDESDDDLSAADSGKNPGQEDDDDCESRPHVLLRKSLMLVSSKNSEERLSKRELREVLECSPASLDSTVAELRNLNVLLASNTQGFTISPQTALQVA